MNSRVTTGDGPRRHLLQKIGQGHNGYSLNLQAQTMNPNTPNGVKKLNSNPNEEHDNDPYKQNLKIKQNMSQEDEGPEQFLKKGMSGDVTPTLHTETPNLLFDQNYDTSPGLEKKRMDLSQNSNNTGKFMHLSTMNNNVGIQKQAEMDQLLLGD